MHADQLPVYPPHIQGDLRLILQNKDLFLLCYKYLEDYRRLNEEQNRIITKEFIETQLKLGEKEIDDLKVEFTNADQKLEVRTRHNETLLGQLSVRGMSTIGDGISRRNLCRSPTLRKISYTDLKTKDLSLFENIALAIEEIQREIKNKLKPLCDFYRDLFYLQLHFVLVLTQVCNYCMPLVTENVGLIDRVFFWTDRPEFDLIKKSGEIADRLKDIYTRTQSVLTLLVENVMFLQNKVELQRNLEQKFQERIDSQQLEKDTILRKIHWSRLDMDLLEEENDRLVGILVKLDPKFVRTDHFNELADYSVRRNYLEGRLTPNGFQAHQGNINLTTSKNPSQSNKNQNLKLHRSESNSTSTNMKSFGQNINASNIDNLGKEIKAKTKRYKSKIKRDAENINKSEKKKDGQSQNNIKINTAWKRHRSHEHNKYEINSNANELSLLKSKSITPKPSIKEKLLSKTKNIFENAFKKQSNNYVKIFEGELLAELSKFTPTCLSPKSLQQPSDEMNNSLDNSIERSLKRKYDFKESNFLQKK